MRCSRIVLDMRVLLAQNSFKLEAQSLTMNNNDQVPNSEASCPPAMGRVSPCTRPRLESQAEAISKDATPVGLRNYVKKTKRGSGGFTPGPFDVVCDLNGTSAKLDKDAKGYIYYNNIIESIKPRK